jgi:hypothetical protein
MIKFFLGDVRLPVTKCKRPKFGNRGRCTWDHGTIKIDGKEYEAHLDTSWGEYVYFQYKGAWRKVKMIPSNMEEMKLGRTWDVDPFASPSIEIKVVD